MPILPQPLEPEEMPQYPEPLPVEIQIGPAIPNIGNNPEQPANDFSAKFRETFVLASISGKDPQVVYIHEILPGDSGTSKKFAIVYQTQHDTSNTVFIDQFKITSTLPTSKFIDNTPYATYFHRNAERQWRRGLCNNTMSGYHIGQTLSLVEKHFHSKGKQFNKKLGIIKFGQLGIDFSTAIPLFNPSYPAYDMAIEKLKNLKAISVPFHTSYCISLSGNSSGYKLYRETSHIGDIDENAPRRIKLNSKLFLQETMDLFRRSGVNCEISVS